jgi:uncharacterized membrane protein (DUF485 family)
MPEQPAPSEPRPAAAPDWDAIARAPEFRALLRAKARFIVPATIFFLVWYFALLVLVAYAPGLMERKVWGPVNLAYLFAVSQFFMAWIIAWLYLRAARRFDEAGRAILARLAGSEKSGEPR